MFMCCLLIKTRFITFITLILKSKVKVLFFFFGTSILSQSHTNKQILFAHLYICFQDIRQTSQLTPDRVN